MRAAAGAGREIAFQPIGAHRIHPLQCVQHVLVLLPLEVALLLIAFALETLMSSAFIAMLSFSKVKLILSVATAASS